MTTTIERWRALLAAVPLLFALGLPVQAQTTIVAFGDSNTYGMNMPREQSYPAQLEALLRAAGKKVQVLNQGVPGSTSADGLSRVDSAVPNGTRLAIVLFGINDVRRGVSAATLESNLSGILRRLKERGVRTVLCFRANPMLTDDYRQAYRRAAQANGATACNFRDGVPKTGYQADGHENAEGNAAVAKNLARIVGPMVK